MLTLAIETATTTVGCALGDQDGLIVMHEVLRGRRHAELLAPAVELLCRQTEVAVADIDAVVVDVGPGLFTGLRVGLATARMMAQMLGVQMVGVSSLDVLAHAAHAAHAAADGERTVAAIIDARRGEYFVNLYRQGSDGPEALGVPRCLRPDELVAELRARTEPVILAGDGAVRGFDLLTAEVPGLDRPAVTHPPVSSLFAIGLSRLMRGLGVEQAEIVPLYLREPDAQINWQTRAGRHIEAQ